MNQRFIKILIILFIIFALSAVSVTALSQIGSNGNEVSKVQRALRDRGYYTGSIDGIFGTATKRAVEQFQKDNNLKVDGIAGKQTLKALGIEGSNNYSGYDSSDYQLLARLISAEARGESYLGQVAVGAVVMNRVEHPSFPDTLAGVVYQRGAFSCLDDGQFYEPIADSAYKAATDVINGMDPSGGAIYYYNPKTATNKWIRSRPVIATIGNHIFCE
jgi:N-acetylmuramoyl-L-alanine amidase